MSPSPDTISAAVRGLGRLMERGNWIAWTNSECGWRHLTPPTKEWEQSGDVALGSYSKSLQFCTAPKGLGLVSRVRWGYGDYVVRELNAAEQEHLYAIIDRVYLERERRAVEERKIAEALEDTRRRERDAAWIKQLEEIGSATS